MNKSVFMFLSLLIFSNAMDLPGLEEDDFKMNNKVLKIKKTIDVLSREKPMNLRKVLRKPYNFQLNGKLKIKKKNGVYKEEVFVELRSTGFKDGNIINDITIKSKNKVSKDILKEIYNDNYLVQNIEDTSFINGKLNSVVKCKLDSAPIRIPIRVLPGYKSEEEVFICDDNSTVTNKYKVDYYDEKTRLLTKETIIKSDKVNNKIILKFRLSEYKIYSLEYKFENKFENLVAK